MRWSYDSRLKAGCRYGENDVDDIARIERGELDIFDPARHRLKVAALDYSIEEAKRIKDWPKLEEAVDAKIEEQRKFVVWWKANIQPAIRPTKKSPGTRLLSVADAEQLTGMRQQRVSDLGQRLRQADKYRKIMLGAGHRAAIQCDGMAMAAVSEACLPFEGEGEQ